MSFIEYASAHVLRALLSVFYLRRSLMGPQFADERFIRGVLKVALELDANKTVNEAINKTAAHAAEGILIAFCQNRPANKDWTGMVHVHKAKLIAKTAYRFAATMVNELEALDEKGDKPNSAQQTEKPGLSTCADLPHEDSGANGQE